MTDEQLENNIAALRAEQAGKPWQWRRIGLTIWLDSKADDRVGEFDVLEHRAKPEPKLRPWTCDEVPLGAEIVNKITRSRFLILAVDSSGRRIRRINGYDTPEEMLEHAEMADGSPCGVIEP